MHPEFEYDIITTHDVREMSKKVQERLNLGWQKAGQLMIHNDANGDTVFLQELIKVVEFKEQLKNKVEDVEFNRKVEMMDKKVKDLLDINNIRVTCENGDLVTYFGEEKSAGIIPSAIVNTLKNSKHVPIDLDEEKVFKEIGSLL